MSRELARVSMKHAVADEYEQVGCEDEVEEENAAAELTIEYLAKA